MCPCDRRELVAWLVAHTHMITNTQSGKSCHSLRPITRTHDAIHKRRASRQEVGSATPCWHCETQALLKCWCLHTSIASAYGSVAMVKSRARLYIVNRKGTVRGYRLYLGSTYHSFHAASAAGRKACNKARQAKPAKEFKVAMERGDPPLHAYSSAKKKRMYLPRPSASAGSRQGQARGGQGLGCTSWPLAL